MSGRVEGVVTSGIEGRKDVSVRRVKHGGVGAGGLGHLGDALIQVEFGSGKGPSDRTRGGG